MQNLYTGGAGQAAVMSEFLFRGYNVAVPEVDRGDDLFVVEDRTGSLSRIQVKAAIARKHIRSNIYAAQVNIPRSQLTIPQTPELTYVFALRCGERWSDFVVVARPVLDNLHRNLSVGTVANQAVVLRLSISPLSIRCSKQDLSQYRNDFSRWPSIQH